MKDTSKSRFWLKHIKDQLSSGQTQKGYCEDHGLNIHTFHFWKKKVLFENAPKSSIKSRKDKFSVGKNKPSHSQKFVPIRISAQQATQASKESLIELSLSEDMELSINGLSVMIRGLSKKDSPVPAAANKVLFYHTYEG